MQPERIEKIVILGGGTAGWIAAAVLSKILSGGNCRIELVESPEISAVGVGEATIPPIINFLKFLDIGEREFIQYTNATFKLGIKFKGWNKEEESYFHPFGSIGVNIDGNNFYPYWQKAKLFGGETQFTDYSPAALMAEKKKFYLPQMAAKDSFLAGASYALHFDAGLVAKYLQAYAQRRGVKQTLARVENVACQQNGNIKTLMLSNGEKVEGDFFIDCSGFNGLLIEQTLNAGYEDWSDFLPCDRAIAVQTEAGNDINPYTLATARDSGWTWNIPLQSRSGNGYVYSSKFCSDDEALAMLSQSLTERFITEPRIIPFVTGRRKSIWKKNCLSLGLSAGFVEPLESTAIHLITRGIRAFVDLFPDKNCSELLVNEYNRIMNREYELVRDFIILHYCTTTRRDSNFWRYCNEMQIPETLQQKIDLFKSQGKLYFDPNDLFKPPSWYCVFEGMGVCSSRYDPLVDITDFDEVRRILKQVRELMLVLVQGLPTHKGFLTEYRFSSWRR